MKKKKEGKRIKSLDGEIPLPEAMIQHIQSFLSKKEAARSTILSKSWYNAWLTRPVLDFDVQDFYNSRPGSGHLFEDFVSKTMQRYQNLGLMIDSFRLCSYSNYSWDHDLIVDAMEMGATTVQLEFCPFSLPQEVLGSETLLKLSLLRCNVDGNYDIRCSRLKSLALEYVDVRSDGGMLKDIISSCASMEELSLSHCSSLNLTSMNLNELHMLRRLVLCSVKVDSMFFSAFASRFRCMKDLTIHNCYGYTNIQLVSPSIETISFKTDKGSERAKFHVPNIRKFTYSASGLPTHLSIDGASREWEFDVSIDCNRFHKTPWFVNLKRLLKKLRLSRISLFLKVYLTLHQRIETEQEVDVKVEVAHVPKPLVLESLMVEAPRTFCSALLFRLLAAFRPKFITHRGCLRYPWDEDLCDRLIQLLSVSNRQDMCRQLGLKKVNVEIYEESEWRPLVSKKPKADSDAKVRLQLVWED